MNTKQIALVAGSTGIVDKNLCNHLAKTGDWTVYGLARNPSTEPGIFPVSANLLDRDRLKSALAGIDVTHVFSVVIPQSVRSIAPRADYFLIAVTTAPDRVRTVSTNVTNLKL
jgi:nucleoside-diphosphate-sugar epimerase